MIEGITTAIDRVRRKLPDSKILLLGVTPRGLIRDPPPGHHRARPQDPFVQCPARPTRRPFLKSAISTSALPS